jgi:hypothetical protein
MMKDSNKKALSLVDGCPLFLANYSGPRRFKTFQFETG